MTKRKQCHEEEIAALETNIQNLDIAVTEATDQRWKAEHEEFLELTASYTAAK